MLTTEDGDLYTHMCTHITHTHTHIHIGAHIPGKKATVNC